MSTFSQHTIGALCALGIALTALCAGNAMATPYDAAFAQAASLERQGRFVEAADRLALVLPEYEEDYALHLFHGWLRFRALQYQKAETAYARAVKLSDGSVDSRLGLAWARLRLGRHDEAEDGFESVLADAPENTSAKEGLWMARRSEPLQMSAQLSLGFHSYQGNPSKNWAASGTLGVGLRAWNRLLAGVTYRYGHFIEQQSQGQGQGFGKGGVSSFGQHEVYTLLGAAFPEWGITGHYAFVSDGSGYFDEVHVVGLTGRWSPYGDITLASSVSLYDDLTVARFETAWKIPIAGGLSLRPGIAVQVTDDDRTTFSGQLTATYEGRLGSVWLGGKYGPEVRPTYLGQPAVYDILDDVDYGLSVGGSIRLGGGTSLTAAYEYARLQRESDGNEIESNAHFFTLGLVWSQLED